MNNQEILISEVHNLIRTATRFKVPVEYLADQVDTWEKTSVVIEIADYLKWIFEYAIETASDDWGSGSVHLEYGEGFDWHIQNDGLCLHIAQLGTEEMIYDCERLIAAIRRHVLNLDNVDRGNCAEIEVVFSGLPKETKLIGRFCVSTGDYEKLDSERYTLGIDIDVFTYSYYDEPEHTYDEVMEIIQKTYGALLGRK